MSKKIAKALIGGNWKCNGSLAQIQAAAEVFGKAPFSANSEVVIAVPSLLLKEARSHWKPEVGVAAQDVGFKNGYGAFTGEQSAKMLAENGVKWTLTGHSERRVGFGFPGETSSVVGVKTKNAIDNGLHVIACIGEQLSDRQNGATMKVCAEQLEAIRAALSEADWKKVVLAYEPVWAIGTGVTATPQQAQETHADIRAWLKKNVSPAVAAETRIIYGGSATAANCNDLYAMHDINGFLVGGASLKPAEFLQIINCTK